MNPNDETRNKILKYFYDRNSAATSRFGKKGTAAKISDVKKDLKALHGLTQQDVMANLTYLIDRGWVKTVDQEKTVTVKGGTVPSVVTWYEIAALGIDKIEGESEFQPPERYPGINISATGSNIIQLGDGNVVNADYRELHSELQALQQAIVEGDALEESQKLEVAADIESLKDQLAKSQPSRDVSSRLWTGIERAAIAAGLVDRVAALTPHIAHLLG